MKKFVTTLVCLAVLLAFACAIQDFCADSSPACSYDADSEYGYLHKEIDNNNQPWNLILINEHNPMPENHEITLAGTDNGEKADERILPYIRLMFRDAEAEGLKPEITSGYRTRKNQQDIFDTRKKEYRALGYTRKEAESLANEYVANPGFSEHESGLALDVNSRSGDSWELYMWLEDNCYKYGFIIRYPQGKEKITGIKYEPWHIRFVGEDAAAYIFTNNLTLEEYLIR